MCVLCIPAFPLIMAAFFFFFFCLYPGQKNAAQLWCAGKTKFIHEEHDNHTVEEQRRC